MGATGLPQAQEIRGFIQEVLAEPLREAYGDVVLPDDFDLLEHGVIDSLGLLELITAVEDRFGLEIDFEQVDPAELTVVGPFCDFVAAGGRTSAEDGDDAVQVSS